ncbi:MAG: hypothetical protein AB7Q17_04995 [Phycisphaerae bacterium]
MSAFHKPHVWFPPALLLLCAVGALLLARDDATLPLSKDMQYYWARHYWQATLDAVSVSCGVGLATYGLSTDYTARGQWTLALLGVGGAALFLVASVQAFHRVAAADGRRAMPAVWAALVAFAIVQFVGVLTVGVTQTALGVSFDIAAIAQSGIATAASTGWLDNAADRREQWSLAGVGLLAALGPAVWLLAWPRWRTLAGGVAPILRVALGYAAFLLAAILLMTALEAPRGGTSLARRDATPETTGLARLERSALQTLAAAGAGLQTSPLADRAFSDGSKFLLAVVILVGGLPGGVTGGMKWPLFALVATAGFRALLAHARRANHGPAYIRAGDHASAPAISDHARAQPDPSTPSDSPTPVDHATVAPPAHRATFAPAAHAAPSAARDSAAWMRAATAVVAAVMLLAVGGALGLLLIESATASAYQPAPSFADALLDAASAVGGAGLTTGLFASVTSRNLSSGIRQATDQYQYGMAWFMLLMLLGRAAPVVVLGRAAASERRAAA